MKKLLLILPAIFTANASFALTCVPKTGELPDASGQFLQDWKDSYVQCETAKGATDKFYICRKGTVVTAFDGNLYRCNDKKWTLIAANTIRSCGDNLLDIETNYDGSSNVGILAANENSQKDWIYYYEVAPQSGFVAIKNYCKYSLTDFDKQLKECNGDFLSYDIENEKYILCDTSHNTSTTITIVDENNTPIEAATVIYLSKSMKSDANGTVILEHDSRNKKQIVEISKNGYLTQKFPISNLQKNSTIKLTSVDTARQESEQTDETKEISSEETGDDDTTYASAPVDPEQLAQATEKLDQAKEKYESARDKEQSLANRTLTAASTAAPGLGTMAAASAYFEQQADADAEADMAAYLATFRCEYGVGQSVKSSNEEITLPGGNELLNYYSEYKTLADSLKTTKKALGLRPGIESEVMYDKAETGLYQYSSVGKTDGGFTSLARALTDETSDDAAEWSKQKDDTSTKLKAGAIAAGAGVVGGAAGNLLINNTDK